MRCDARAMDASMLFSPSGGTRVILPYSDSVQRRQGTQRYAVGCIELCTAILN